MTFFCYSFTTPVLATKGSKCHEIYLGNYASLLSDID